MRGDETPQGRMLGSVSPGARVPEDRPLRPVRAMVDRAPVGLSPEFEGLGMDEKVRYATQFTKNRDRLRDGTLIEAWGGTQELQEEGQERGRRKKAKPGYPGHVLMENRNGSAVGTRVTGADKGHDVRECIGRLRDPEVTPQMVVKQEKRKDGIDGRTTRHEGSAIGPCKRKPVEQNVGWGKPIGLPRRTSHRGRKRVSRVFTFTMAARNPVRMRILLAPTQGRRRGHPRIAGRAAKRGPAEDFPWGKGCPLVPGRWNQPQGRDRVSLKLAFAAVCRARRRGAAGLPLPRQSRPPPRRSVVREARRCGDIRLGAGQSRRAGRRRGGRRNGLRAAVSGRA